MIWKYLHPIAMTFSIDCSCLDFCCGPCSNYHYHSTKTSKERFEIVKYGYLILTNVYLCTDCYVRYVSFSEDNNILFLEEDARYIFHKLNAHNTTCIACEIL